jgi:hypothetical protein
MQDDFENWMDQRARDLRGDWFDGKVAGITWNNPDGSSRQVIASRLATYDELDLVPQPDNPFDPNAIAVMAPDGQQVGFLDSRLAGEISRRMKRGGGAKCFVRAVRESYGCAGVAFGLVKWEP